MRRSVAARLVVAALILWAVLDVLRTVLAVGHYENRIEVVTHGNVDVLPAWLAYVIVSELMPRDAVTVAADRLWMLGALVAAAAFVAWLHQARRTAGRLGGALTWAPGWVVGGWFVPVANLMIPYLVVRDVRRASGPAARLAPVGRWWVSVLGTVFLYLLSRLYAVVTSHGGRLHETALDTRTAAYPLWTAGTVMVVVTAVLSIRVARRISEAQDGFGPQT
ncbi:DUF4328 domain-containing protein [Micromonospora sp. NPDC000668]|uniref:DUF4328 domain-containing protein n=1 Tax=Micromonospora sp. NPDC000668 TaxID=3364219 RepID=UPI0036B84A96